MNKPKMKAHIKFCNCIKHGFEKELLKKAIKKLEDIHCHLNNKEDIL